MIDLFSGAGGMSYGFHKHPAFKIVAAADAELGKPSTGEGKLQCNKTYVRNIGVSPALSIFQKCAKALEICTFITRRTAYFCSFDMSPMYRV